MNFTGGIIWQSLVGLTNSITKKKPTKSVQSKRFRGKRETEYNFEKLEDRRVLATFYLDANGSYFISGTEGNDVMVAVVVQSNVRVTVNSTTKEQPISSVAELVFLGRAGNDHITNDTSIPSRMYGGNGNDTLISGWGNDRLIGNQGNDSLTARGGNNILIGSAGSNTIRGGDGNDIIRGGYGGKNVIYGGGGDDIIFAGDQGDEIYGEAGNDSLYGGIGNDIIYGGSGSDLIMGNAGNDLLYAEGSNNRIYGGSGNDSLYADGANNRLFGGAGNDGLFGGLGGGGLLQPGLGKNRILVAPGQPIPTTSADNAVIRFVNRSSNWTYKEIEAMDRGLRALHHRTIGTKILKDTTSNVPMTLVKYSFNDPEVAGNDGWNYHYISVLISPNGYVTETYTREIRIRDFDENDSHRYRYAGLLLIHEISHSWDSAYEINRVVAKAWVWDYFLALSSWTNQNPNSTLYTKAPVNTQEVFEYQVVGNQLQIPVREWWYRSDSVFARSYGANNGKEDWGVTWELSFFDEVYGGSPSVLGYTPVPNKVAMINELLIALA